MTQDDPEAEPTTAKFEPCQAVKIKVPKEGEDLGSPVPMDKALGERGVVETEGRVYMSEQGEKGHALRAYFVRIEGIGPVLVGEGWLEPE